MTVLEGVTRRHLASLGLGLATLPLVGCGRRADQGRITTLTWGNYAAPQIYGAYAAKHGGPPKLVLQVNVEETFQKLRTGFAADTAHPDSFAVGRWRDAGLLRPIDTKRLTAWADVLPELKTIRGAATAEGQWFVPCTWSSTSVIYRPDLVDPAYVKNPTWKILWDPRYKGRIAIADSMDEVLVATALTLGVKDPFAMTDAELAAVGAVLRKQRDNALFYWTSRAEVEQALASGEVIATLGWSPSYVELKRSGVNVAYMDPAEGRLNLVDGLVWLKNGKGAEDGVYDYLDGWLSPEAGKYVIEHFGHGHSNAKSYARADPAALARFGLTDPRANLASGVFLQEIDGRVREKYNRLFEEVKAGG